MTPRDPATAALLARAAAGYRAALVSHAIRVLCKAAGVVVIARLVSPADHGRFAMAASVVFVVVLFRDLGLGAAAVQAPELTEEQQSTLWRAHLLLGLMLAGAALALGPVAAAFFHEPQVNGLLAVSGGVFALLGLNGWPRVLLARGLRFAELNRLETWAAALGTLAMITAAAAGAGAFTFVLFSLVGEALIAVGAWRVCGWRPRAPARWSSLAPLWRPSADVTGHQIVTTVMQQLESVCMGRWFGAGALGLYNRPSQLLALPNQHVSAPLTQVLTAALARTGPTDGSFAAQVRSTANLSAHLTLPIAAVCFAMPDEIVRLLLGAAWPEAAPLLRWLSLGWAATYLSSTLYAVCVATGQTRRLLSVSVVALMATLAGLWAGRSHGPQGLAAGVALANLATLLPRLWWATRHTPVRVRNYAAAFAGPLVVSVSLAVGCAGALALGGRENWVLNLLRGSIGGALAVALALVLFTQIRTELARLWAVVLSGKATEPAPGAQPQHQQGGGDE